MNVYQVNALTDVPISLQVAEVTTHLERQPPPSSIVIMIHGCKFDHRDPAHCPHATMYHPHPVATDFRTRSWPSERGRSEVTVLPLAFHGRRAEP